MRRALLTGIATVLLMAHADGQTAREALIARAKSLELPTPYEPPPGDPLQHHASGYAKIMCSAVFVTGLDPAFAAENVGYFTAPYEVRKTLGTPEVDRAGKQVHVRLPGGQRRTAKYLGQQGCVTLPLGSDTLGFTPKEIRSALPDPATQPWPMGDVLPKEPIRGIDLARVKAAVDTAFEPAETMTAAVVVTWRGQIVGERYGDGIGMHTPLESWSMGKSLTATLMGTLIERGDYTLAQKAPIPEWQGANDPRAAITIANILNMSSGLRIRAPQDPDFDPAGTYPDHFYYYTGDNAFRWAATRPLQWPPNTVGRYRNTDPVLTNYLIRLAVDERKEDYLSFPQRALFDHIGVRTMVMDLDPAGNFLTQGYELGSARDWARIANLYLRDGIAPSGERLLPAGFVTFASSLAPAWAADGRPIYGGFFWLNGDRSFPAPTDAYYMSGVGGQSVLIVPSHELVIVRLGHYKGASAGGQSLRKAVAALIAAVPASSAGRGRR